MESSTRRNEDRNVRSGGRSVRASKGNEGQLRVSSEILIRSRDQVRIPLITNTDSGGRAKVFGMGLESVFIIPRNECSA